RVVRRRLRAREAQRDVGVVEVLRLQTAQDDRRRAVVRRLRVELRIVAREVARGACRGVRDVAGVAVAGYVVPEQIEARVTADVELLHLRRRAMFPERLQRALDEIG